jgi:hypothetical protein
VHNNWADGGADGNVHAQKVFRFREHLLWHSDADTRYTEERLYMSYEHSGEGGRVGVWEEMDALRSALAMAQLLGRTLILPEFLCGGEAYGNSDELLLQEPVRCTADSFLGTQSTDLLYWHQSIHILTQTRYAPRCASAAGRVPGPQGELLHRQRPRAA